MWLINIARPFSSTASRVFISIQCALHQRENLRRRDCTRASPGRERRREGRGTVWTLSYRLYPTGLVKCRRKRAPCSQIRGERKFSKEWWACGYEERRGEEFELESVDWNRRSLCWRLWKFEMYHVFSALSGDLSRWKWAMIRRMKLEVLSHQLFHENFWWAWRGAKELCASACIQEAQETNFWNLWGIFHLDLHPNSQNWLSTLVKNPNVGSNILRRNVRNYSKNFERRMLRNRIYSNAILWWR